VGARNYPIRISLADQFSHRVGRIFDVVGVAANAAR
jgi:hypothetical protein